MIRHLIELAVNAGRSRDGYSIRSHQHHSLVAEESRAEFVPSDSDLIQLMDLRDSNEDALLPALTTLEVPKLFRSNRVHTWPSQSKMQHHQFDTVLIDGLSETFLGLEYIFNAINRVGVRMDQNRLLDVCSTPCARVQVCFTLPVRCPDVLSMRQYKIWCCLWHTVGTWGASLP